MAHFAEIDQNNKVLRVVVGCNQDVANNGGELSEQAAEHFKKVCPLSIHGVKWVQTSYNSNFRGHFAGVGNTWNPELNIFVAGEQPFSSWTLNTQKGIWEAPVEKHSNLNSKMVVWNEEILQWVINPDYDITEEQIQTLTNNT